MTNAFQIFLPCCDCVVSGLPFCPIPSPTLHIDIDGDLVCTVCAQVRCEMNDAVAMLPEVLDIERMTI